MIIGGLVNVVPLRRHNQFTAWRHRVATAGGIVGYEVVVSDSSGNEALWLYVIHGRLEYIGCFRTESFTPELIAQTAAEFACSTITH